MKKTFILSSYLLVFLLSSFGCEKGKETSLNQFKFDETISVIKLSNEFELELPDNHPDKLAIATPDGNWFYIQGNGIKKQLMSKEAFIKAVALSIDTSTLEGTHWVDGKATISAVFTKTGIYSIYLSDNLETEIDNSLTYIKKLKLIN